MYRIQIPMSANKIRIRKRISKTIPRSSRCLNSIPPIEKRKILKVNNLTKYSQLEERERERLKQLMVVTCPVWWFFVDPATETGRTGRWKRRKASRHRRMKGLEEERGGERRREKRRRRRRDGCPQDVKILWLVLDKDRWDPSTSAVLTATRT